MRHGKTVNHLGRTHSHRAAMLSNMATSLLIHKRINTTIAKAKELRKYVEPLITKAKTNTTHSRRVVFSYLKQKESINLLFGEIIEKVGDRPGGYTRILHTGMRAGDNADMCMIELVDFNEIYTNNKKAAAKPKRRGGSKKKKGTDDAEATSVSAIETAKAVETKEETESSAEASEQTEETKE